MLEEGLLIPFYVKGEAVGTIWVVSHDDSCRFDAEDLRVMTNLGIFAAAAYQTVLSLNAGQRMVSIIEGSDDAIVSKDLNGMDGLKHAIEGPFQPLQMFTSFLRNRVGRGRNWIPWLSKSLHLTVKTRTSASWLPVQN